MTIPRRNAYNMDAIKAMTKTVAYDKNPKHEECQRAGGGGRPVKVCHKGRSLPSRRLNVKVGCAVCADVTGRHMKVLCMAWDGVWA